MIKKLIVSSSQLYKKTLQSDNERQLQPKIMEKLDACSDYICSRIDNYTSSYKRDKIVESMSNFIAPTAFHLSTYWNNRPTGEIELKSSTFQYVSIVNTLEGLFSYSKFSEIYFKYNDDMRAEDGLYSHFNSGETYKNCTFFNENKNALQIQIFHDAFEPASALKSRASVYKTIGIYFSIRNMPISFTSKLDHIFLVAVLLSNDTKDDRNTYDSVWRLIMRDILDLQTNGIESGRDCVVKGSLVNVAGDNAGANQCFGFAEGFNASYSCRMCRMSKTESQKCSIEKCDMLRTKENYAADLSKLEEQKRKIGMNGEKHKINFEETRGLKNQCVLNELPFFHILDNVNVDPMHDLNEGAIPFLMGNLFKLCFKSKMFDEFELNSKVQFFNFGYLNTDIRPSSINVSKKNCNQNASQSRNLFLHLPFILYDDICSPQLLAEIWPCVS